MINPLKQLKIDQKNLAQKIRSEKDPWDSNVFRHQHIVYCELRGRTRTQIEIPAESNKPNEQWIKKFKKEILEKIELWRTK